MILSKSINIVVIGCGQLGSRYVQGFAKCDKQITIYGVDVNETSLTVCGERFKEIKSINSSFVPVKNIEDCPKDPFLIVVATNADTREDVFKKIVSYFDFSFLILEKVLFQSLSQYISLENYLITNKNKIFINCPRRAYESYIKLYEIVNEEPTISMIYEGSNWAMASNSIHFIDLYCYLTNQNKITVHTQNLSHKLLENKRPGMIEFEGVLKIDSEKGNLKLVSESTIKENKVTIDTTNYSIEIIEKVGSKMLITNKKTREDSMLDFSIEYQSDLSLKILNDLLMKGSSTLPKAEATAEVHKELLTEFLKHYNLITHQNSLVCPIT